MLLARTSVSPTHSCCARSHKCDLDGCSPIIVLIVFHNCLELLSPILSTLENDALSRDRWRFVLFRSRLYVSVSPSCRAFYRSCTSALNPFVTHGLSLECLTAVVVGKCSSIRELSTDAKASYCSWDVERRSSEDQFY